MAHGHMYICVYIYVTYTVKQMALLDSLMDTLEGCASRASDQAASDLAARDWQLLGRAIPGDSIAFDSAQKMVNRAPLKAPITCNT